MKHSKFTELVITKFLKKFYNYLENQRFQGNIEVRKSDQTTSKNIYKSYLRNQFLV